jgi:hypothetical protein
MTSIARIAANRANARKSTGPKTAAGKAKVSHNARRHGLSRPLFCEGDYTPHVEGLAREIAGQNADDEHLALARNIAIAQLDLARVRIAKRDLQDAANFGTTNAKYPRDWSVLPQLQRLDRYEQRVFTRRRRAVREFCKSKPLDGGVVEPAAAVRVTQDAAGVFCKTKPMSADEDTSNNRCNDSVGASVRSSAFTRPLSAGGKEEPPKGGTTNNTGRFTYCSKGPESSASVPDKNVSDNSCRTNPTDHKSMNPTPPREIAVERFCKTKPSDANAAQRGCVAPTLSRRARQCLQNKANGQRCKEFKTAFDGMRAARFDASRPNRARVISWSGPTFIRGP